ncbi:MAG: hypothetical protein JW922_00575 [Paludibacteraceae bacterium]|nr:hypothetical protein [Paludibacteraceae bacterium]
MKTQPFLLVLLLTVFSISCSKTDDVTDVSNRVTPLALPVDMNDDGISDFKVEFNTTITDGSPEVMIGYLFPLNSTQVLINSNTAYSMFLQPLDIVTANPSLPLSFQPSYVQVIRKRVQETSWTVNSAAYFDQAHMNPAYVGVKFLVGDVWYVGWAKFQFDTSNAEPTLVAKKYALDDCIIDQ